MIKRIPPIILALLWSVPAFAAHPLMTDDTGTQGKGKFQFELNSENLTDHEVKGSIFEKETGGNVVAALTYGIADNLDFAVESTFQWSSLMQNGSIFSDEKGIGDTTLKIKWKFFESSPDQFSLALKPRVTFPTGDPQKGLGNGNISGGVLLIATREWEHRALHCNFGYAHNSYSLAQDRALFKHDIWNASVAAEVHMTKKLRSVADISIDSNSENTEFPNRVFVLGGLIYSVTDSFDLDLGVKAGLNNAETDKTILAGLTVRF